MPDLLIGTKVKGLDTPPTVWDHEDDFFTFTNTAYGVAFTAGVYVDCGVAFIAPTTGRVLLNYGAAITNDTAGAFSIMAPVVREGDVIGSGSSILAAADANALYVFGTAQIRAGVAYLLTGLTPGDPYNVRLEHGRSAGNGNLGRRYVIVAPAT